MKISQQRDILSQLRRDPAMSDHYKLVELMGEGSFGKVVKAINKNTLETVALKVEHSSMLKQKVALKNQANILRKLQNKLGIPKVYNYVKTKNWIYLELEMLEHDLSQTYSYSIPQITELALELVAILEAIHTQNVIHQDLKPQNLMRSKNGKLHLIDFGLSKILTQNKSQSIRGFVGTPRYASVRAHNMLQQFKRDDLQSAFYVIAYLYYQKLPWSRLKVPESQKMERIKLAKLGSRRALFSNMPSQFQNAFDYITNLQAEAEPNYNMIKSFFKRHKTLDFNAIKPFGLERSRKNGNTSTFIGNNLLQLPESTFPKSKARKGEPYRFGQNIKQQLSNSRSCQANRSDIIVDQLLHFADDFQEDKQNFDESTVLERQLHHCQSVKRTLNMKNPFR